MSLRPAIGHDALKPLIGIFLAVSEPAHGVLGGLPLRGPVGRLQGLETLSGELSALDLDQGGDDLPLKLVAGLNSGGLPDRRFGLAKGGLDTGDGFLDGLGADRLELHRLPAGASS